MAKFLRPSALCVIYFQCSQDYLIAEVFTFLALLKYVGK